MCVPNYCKKPYLNIFQVVSYGSGGHYEPHVDYYGEYQVSVILTVNDEFKAITVLYSVFCYNLTFKMLMK